MFVSNHRAQKQLLNILSKTIKANTLVASVGIKKGEGVKKEKGGDFRMLSHWV